MNKTSFEVYMSTSVKKRNANIELLRIISIFMVTILHATGKSEAVGNYFLTGNVNNLVAEFFVSFSIAAVNIFMLISGYFLVKSSFKISRLIELVLQTVFYTVFAFLVCLSIGFIQRNSVDTYTLLNVALPIHMNVYWFISVYIALYILSPLISAGVNAMSKKQFEVLLIILLIYESVFKSVLPVVLTVDAKGYDFLWCLTVFLIGAYIRLYGIKFLSTSSRGMLLYIAASLCIFAERTVLLKINASSGRLGTIGAVSHDYNHIFVIAAAVGIFTAFLHKKEITGSFEKLILFMSPMTLGVYLIHENMSVRYLWTALTGINGAVIGSPFSFVIHLLGGCVFVYIIGSFIDYIRIGIFGIIKKFIVKD